MTKPIQSIVIVGGGTAGWMTAAYLNRALKSKVAITLIESSSVDPIGVGEATIPTLTNTMEFIGFTDDEWLPHVGGTYKAGIKFANWTEEYTPGKESFYLHPFVSRPEPHALPYDKPYMPAVSPGYSILHYAHKKRLEGSSESIADLISPFGLLAKDKKSPCNDDKSINLRSAYHLDAGRLGGFLRKVAIGRGVNRVVDHVVTVDQNESGFITAVHTQEGKKLEADLFIDCSGFRSLLLGQTLQEPFLSDNHHLLCNAAVAISAKNNPERDGINPFTTATGLKHGWVWDIPLFDRNGCGYVYCNDFTGADAAETELRSFLGPRSDEFNANHIKMRVGHSRNWWVKNCVSIGLSGSFIEPLESTGIFLIEYGLSSLVSHFPDLDFNPGRIKQYNRCMLDIYEETRDFIVLHYAINKRNDSEFWQVARQPSRFPNSLKEKLAWFEDNIPILDSLKLAIFPAASYLCIMDGCGFIPKKGYPILEIIGYQEGETILNNYVKNFNQQVSQLPDQYQYLKSQQKKKAVI